MRTSGTGAALPSATARRAVPADHPALRRLWLLFRHEMSQFTGELPAVDGTYRSVRLDHALDTGRRDAQAWLLSTAEHPLGLAVTRAMDEPARVLTSFFLVTPARRGGLGTAFARTVLTASPGTWSIAHQPANRPAAAFWTRVADGFGPGWRQELREVPGRPGAPPDAWLTLIVR